MPADASSSPKRASAPADGAESQAAAGPSPLRPAVFDEAPNLVAGFSTRAGGASEGAYESLNLGLSTDDKAARVRENRRRLGAALGFAPDQWVVAGQVHGDHILRAEEAGLVRGYDGLVTERAGLLLCISAADCAAVLMADPEAGVAGACHSGWRGTVQRISAKTVGEMSALGARPERVRAYVSPCISLDHFEVGEEVAERFDEAFVRRPSSAVNEAPNAQQQQQQHKPHVDLKAAIAAQLRDAGVPEEHIEVSPHCTIGDRDTFFSHRASGGVTGRMMGVIGLEEA